MFMLVVWGDLFAYMILVKKKVRLFECLIARTNCLGLGSLQGGWMGVKILAVIKWIIKELNRSDIGVQVNWKKWHQRRELHLNTDLPNQNCKAENVDVDSVEFGGGRGGGGASQLEFILSEE